MAGLCANLSLVVSSGGSAACEWDCKPQIDPAPASAALLRNSRRVQPRRFSTLVCRAAFRFSTVGSKPKPICAVFLLMVYFTPAISGPFPNPKSKIGKSKIGSRFQFLSQLSQKSPIRSLCDEFLRARFDHAGFVQAQRVKAHGALRIVLMPAVVADGLKGIDGMAVIASETLLGQRFGNLLRLRGTKVGGLQDGA